MTDASIPPDAVAQTAETAPVAATTSASSIPGLTEQAPRASSTDAQDLKGRLTSLTAQATAKYAIKDYIQAAEYYSQATELQAELNGEMAVENAELLYSYGRCLYHVAVKNSDVLGGEAAGKKLDVQAQKGKPMQTVASGKGKRKREVEESDGRGVSAISSSSAAAETSLSTSDTQQRLAEETVASLVEEKIEGKEDVDDSSRGDKSGEKPFFRFTGDENWDDSGEEDEEGGEEAAGEDAGGEEDDDFANAFEVLDLSRLLYRSRLEQLLQQTESGGLDNAQPEAISRSEDDGVGDERGELAERIAELRLVKERISDIHDLQAEIALEGERFPAAVVDLKEALALKAELLPKESPLLAECHYKLSLALEFSSVTQQRDEDGNPQGTAHVDDQTRSEAASEMSKAIESCTLRVAKEEAELDSLIRSAGEEMAPQRQKLKLSIQDVNEMIDDMRARLADLQKPAVSSLNDPRGTGAIDGSTPLSGILGQILGESPEEQKKRLEQASLEAKDLTGLVKKGKKAGEQQNAQQMSSTNTSALDSAAPPTANGGSRSGGRVEQNSTANGDNNDRSDTATITQTKRKAVHVAQEETEDTANAPDKKVKLDVQADEQAGGLG